MLGLEQGHFLLCMYLYLVDVFGDEIVLTLQFIDFLIALFGVHP